MATYVVMGIVVLACIQIYLYDALEDFLVDHLSEQLTRETGIAHELWREEGGSLDVSSVDALADRIGMRLGLRATIIDGKGVVLGDSEVAVQDLSGLENHADRPEVVEAKANGLGQSLRYSATLDRHMLYVARAAREIGDGRAVVRLAMPLNEVEQIEGHIHGALWVASLIGISITLVLVYAASRFASRPIEQLTASARAMATADGPVEMGLEVPVAAARELWELGRAMNEMHGQIQQRVGQLSTEKARLEAILNSVSEGILVTDLAGQTVLANKALLSMFSVEDWREGCNPSEIVRNNKVTEAIAATLDAGEPLTLETNISGAPERYLDVHVALIEREGTLQGTVTVFHDITRLRKLERVRSDFVANVSHELRTPLTAIKGCAETLADGAIEDQEAASRFVGVIGNHVDRLSNLLSDLLDLSRLESDTLTLDEAPISLAHLATAATDAVGQLAADKGIAIEAAVDESLRAVGDRQLIEQALINLFENAVKYTAAGGQVLLQVRALDRGQATEEIAARAWSTRGAASALDESPALPDLILIEVTDSGIGIPSDSIDRVFERFYRVDTSRSREMGGTGLGLSIVRHILEVHGQRVFLDSELGRGSTFGFTLNRA